MAATNRPWTWKIGSACSSTSPRRQRQYRCRATRVRAEVAVGQHRALAAPGRARGVEDRGEIVGARAARSRIAEAARCRSEQAAVASSPSVNTCGHLAARGDRRDPAWLRGRAHQHLRLRRSRRNSRPRPAGRRCSTAGRHSRREGRRDRAAAPRAISPPAPRRARRAPGPATPAGSPACRWPARRPSRCSRAARRRASAPRSRRRRGPRGSRLASSE